MNDKVVISQEEIDSFINKRGKYFQVSAKNGLNVTELFEDITQNVRTEDEAV